MSTTEPQTQKHQLAKKIMEFEARLRQFNFLDSNNCLRKAQKSGASPNENGFLSPRVNVGNSTPIGCKTSPLPRRPIPLNMNSVCGATSNGENNYDSASTSTSYRRGSNATGVRFRPRFCYPWSQTQPIVNRVSDSIENERRLNEIIQMSGKLRIGGKEYKAAFSDLEQVGELGEGTCGHVVKMMFRPTGHLLAVKQMRRTGNKEENKRVLMDLEVVLPSHDYPYIVQSYGCFITDSDVWICMELMATCFDKLKRRIKQGIPERILGKMTVAVVKALNYLKERHGIIHRDVKPSNILLDFKGTIKLCDFGISGRLVDSKAKTRTGCAAYMAPERIDPPNPQQPDYDIRADVWSLGITLVELATGIFPYSGCSNDFEMLIRVLSDAPPQLPDNLYFSAEFRSFVNKCLMKDSKDRPKYHDLLVHPFIHKYENQCVDVATWLADAMQTPLSPNNNSCA